jgi:hypothetical protein
MVVWAPAAATIVASSSAWAGPTVMMSPLDVVGIGTSRQPLAASGKSASLAPSLIWSTLLPLPSAALGGGLVLQSVIVVPQATIVMEARSHVAIWIRRCLFIVSTSISVSVQGPPTAIYRHYLRNERLPQSVDDIPFAQYLKHLVIMIYEL